MTYICGVYVQEQYAYQRRTQSECIKNFSFNQIEKENGEDKPEFWMKICTDFQQIPIEFYSVSHK